MQRIMLRISMPPACYLSRRRRYLSGRNQYLRKFYSSAALCHLHLYCRQGVFMPLIISNRITQFIYFKVYFMNKKRIFLALSIPVLFIAGVMAGKVSKKRLSPTTIYYKSGLQCKVLCTNFTCLAFTTISNGTQQAKINTCKSSAYGGLYATSTCAIAKVYLCP